MIKFFSLVFAIVILAVNQQFAQFPPPAGQPGSTAMHKDSSAFRAWADGCTAEIGYINFVDTTVVHNESNRATFGFPEDALGFPDNFVVSLGDKGIITLTFPSPIFDSIGPDFAVFENAFSDEFLELGFVEASSDGIRFVRFPSVSRTQSSLQIPTFGTLDATHIHNLAGKYRLFYGTPFDLSDLKDSTGIDLNAVTHIRIIDVGGNISNGYQSFDSEGNIINDPWPTPFFTCGVDLDAVGVIHTHISAIDGILPEQSLNLFPNPVGAQLHVKVALNEPVVLTIYDLFGSILYESTVSSVITIPVSSFSSGVYLVRIMTAEGSVLHKRIIKE